MISLRHPELRGRDIRHLVNLHSSKLTWETDNDSSSEWVYFSFETPLHEQKSKEWIENKCISEDAEVIIIRDDFELSSASWADLNATPNDYFAKNRMTIIEKDFRWILEYNPVSVARFGRYEK